MVLSVLPAFVTGVAISVSFARMGQLQFLPAVWLTLYGCGALTTSFFAPRSIAVLGATCLTLGIISLVVLPDRPLLTMSVGFGLTHGLFGFSVLVAERREKREQAFWAAVEQIK